MKKLIMLISLTFLFSCQKVDESSIFVIKEGNHYCCHTISQSCGSEIRFIFLIDESWYYENQKTPGINKVIGISDGSNHMKYSVRLGWQCIDGRIHLYNYCHTGDKDKHEAKELGVFSSGWHTGRVTINTDNYAVEVDGISNTITKDHEPGSYHLLYPYFGGVEYAPHDVKLEIKLN